jgi:hypothetical protein
MNFAPKLMPTPKWKLVVDVGSAPPKFDDAKATDTRVQDVLKLLAEHTPTHRNSPYSPYLPGFTSLRLLMLKRTRTKDDNGILSTMLESYSSYLSSGKESGEIAWMMARDYMLLTQLPNQIGSSMAPSLQSYHQIQQVPPQHRVQQVLQPQLSQLQPAIANQFQQQQMQQIGALQHAAQLQSGSSPVPFGAGLNPNFMGTAGTLFENSLSSFGPHAVPNGVNGIATLNELAQQHHNANGGNCLFHSSAMSRPNGQEK